MKVEHLITKKPDIVITLTNTEAAVLYEYYACRECSPLFVRILCELKKLL